MISRGYSQVQRSSLPQEKSTIIATLPYGEYTGKEDHVQKLPLLCNNIVRLCIAWKIIEGYGID